MATHCQIAARSRSGERQNIGAVNSFEGRKGGSQLQTKNQISVVNCKMCFFDLFFEIHNILYMKCLWKNRSHYCIQFCIEKT